MLGHILNASLSINDKLQDKKKLSNTDQAKITNYKKKLLPRIKDIRKSMGMTQIELSNYLKNTKDLKISRSSIAKYESGVNYPSKKTLKKLANALKVSEYYLSGKGLSKDEIEPKIIQTLFSAYYEKIDDLTELKNNITHLLLLKGDEKTANSFFDSENKFRMEPYVISFWKNKFQFLFGKDFMDTLEGSTEKEFLERINLAMTKHVERQLIKTTDKNFIKDYTRTNSQFLDKFYKKDNIHALIQAINNEIKILEKYKNLIQEPKL